MKVGLSTYSSIGDNLLALPLINGLKDNNYDVIQIGNNKIVNFYNYLKIHNIINDYKLYISNDVFSYLNINNLDILLFPPNSQREGILKFVYDNKKVLSFFSKYILNIKKIEFIESVLVNSKGKKNTSTINLNLSYISKLENAFNIKFKIDYLFFKDSLINEGKKNIKQFFDNNYLDEEDFIIIYAFTKDITRSMTKELLTKLIRIGCENNYRIFLVGNENDGKKYEEFIGNQINFKKNKVLNLAGKLTFSELAGLFNKSRFVFSIDGGLLHFSLACKAKTISFWGSTIPESIIYPNHPYHFPMCRYLDFQPFLGESFTQDQISLSFKFTDEEIKDVMMSVLTT